MSGGRNSRLSDEEVTMFCSAVGTAPRQMRHARQAMSAKYDLGPRGLWILGMIEVGVNSPSRLSDILCIGRSLFTNELNRLIKAGLVEARKDGTDGRRSQLRLTKKGKSANRELMRTMSDFINERLAGHSREEVLLCTNLLRNFAGADWSLLSPGSAGG